ncbi:MAG: response regulator transcription factor [Candidatus Pristimantibacillus lignocellulolyticus]|uniref:Response regulator transcription factor n=1 Tax=Candidatus Pristimantibacillus lignocellulolyticus TaxID=2994561 RepID=A0A9J6ZK78_9BACL|nr:MAG: response regulator transcription factor [Candidatus Pristimantibacillus lignocellulolyticus]
MKLMIVEDDRTIAAGLQYSLEQEQYEVVICHDATSAKQMIEEQYQQLELYIFDLNLPDGSGYDLCKLVKSLHDAPVIFLSAIDEEVNIVMGLDMGADDYITKPFRVRELLSRMKSVMRRYQVQAPARNMTTLQNITINTAEAKVYKNEQELVLTALEYRLLLIFANHPNQILSRSQLLEQIWDVAGDFVNDNTLTVYIKRLREKLEDDAADPKLIVTIRGLGYKCIVD